MPLTWDKADPDTWRIRPTGTRRGDHHLRLPGRPARQRDGVEPGRLPDGQRHQRLPLSGRPEPRLSRHGDGDHRVRLARGHRHDAGRRAARLPRRQLPRPGGHAVLRRAVRLRQHPGGRASGSGWPATRRAPWPGAARTEFWARAGEVPAGRDRRLRRGAVRQLHQPPDLRPGVRRRERARAPELPRRHLHAAADREPGARRRSPRTRSSTSGT